MKMNVYSFQEMADMHIFYGYANGNSMEDRHLLPAMPLAGITFRKEF
jgi:hypothetical protein